MPDDLLTYPEAAVELEVSTRTIERWVLTREIRRQHVTEPRLGWRIPRSEVERIKAKREDT